MLKLSVFWQLLNYWLLTFKMWFYTSLEMCMGIGKTGIPWVPWEWKYDQPWDGNWHENWIMVCGKWKLRRGSGKKSLHTVTSKHLQKALIAFKFISHATIVQLYYLIIFLCKLTFNFLGAVNSFDHYFNMAITVAQACCLQKKIIHNQLLDVMIELPQLDQLLFKCISITKYKLLLKIVLQILF